MRRGRDGLRVSVSVLVAVAAVTLAFDLAGLAMPVLETPRFPDGTEILRQVRPQSMK